jgi:hypothetical protein
MTVPNSCRKAVLEGIYGVIKAEIHRLDEKTIKNRLL